MSKTPASTTNNANMTPAQADKLLQEKLAAEAAAKNQQQQQQQQIQIASLGLKCAHHSNEAVVGICFAESCTLPSRLLCIQCVFQDHAEHMKKSVQVKEIDESQKNGIFMENWPTQPVCKDIRKFERQQSQQTTETPDKRIEKLKADADKEFQTVQNIMKERTKDVNMDKKEEIKKLNTDAEKIFKLDTVRQEVSKFSKKEITNNDLNQKITDFVHTPQRDEDIQKLQRDVMKIKQNQKLIFVPEEYEEITQELLMLIRKIPQQVMLQNTLNFIPATIKESQNNFKVSENGLVLNFEKDSDTVPIMCVSDILRKDTIYSLEVKIEGEFVQNSLKVSLVQDDFLDEIPQSLYYCLIRGPRYMSGQWQMQGQEWLHVNNLRGAIKIKISTTQNKFQILSFDERGGIQLNNFKFNCSSSSNNWRLAFINQGKPIRITKVGCTIDHL